MRTLALIIIAACSLGAAMTLAHGLEQREATRRADHRDIVYLPPPWLVRAASLGHRELAADYYWMQALQYYGNTRHRSVSFRDLHRYVNLAIDLDPDFEYAYQFGATTVPFNEGPWKWVNVDESTEIARKGIDRFPDKWHLWLQIGFNHSVLRDDYEAGAEAYRMAAEIAGPPVEDWIRSLVSRLHAASGHFEKARAYVQEMLAQTEDAHSREVLERRLMELDSEKQIQVVERAIEGFVALHGEPPSDIGQLVADGMLEGHPVDPLGGEILLGPDGSPYSTAIAGGRLRPFRDPDERKAR